MKTIILREMLRPQHILRDRLLQVIIDKIEM